jgi:hypothetical protein
MYSFNKKESEELENIYNSDNSELFEQFKDKRIKGIRTKTIKSGDYLEIENYPIWETRKPLTDIRKEKQKESREVQKKLNKRNSKKNLIRLINANFTDKDIWETLTYSQDKLPKDEEMANKFIKNYIRRLDYYQRKYTGLPLKYVYTTEIGDKGRVHHHIVLNYFDRDDAEKRWTGGGRTQTRRLQADENGYAGLGSYISKPKKSCKDPDAIFPLDYCKKYIVSKNLKKPIVSIADKKFTKRQIENIIRNDEVKDYFNKRIKDYRVASFYNYFSELISGVYLYVRMYKRN